jgi:hypothetical protein
MTETSQRPRCAHSALRLAARIVIVAALAIVSGCGSGGGGAIPVTSAATAAAAAGKGTLSGVASLTGTNQAAASRLPGAALRLERQVVGALSVRVMDLSGKELARTSTSADGKFTVKGLPTGVPLQIEVKAGAVPLVTFCEVPVDQGDIQDVGLDPLATVIAHRIHKIHTDRRAKLGKLKSLNAPVLLLQVRRALEGLRAELGFELSVVLADLKDAIEANAATFDRLVPEALRAAGGDSIAIAESSADLEAGGEAGLLVAIARRLFHTHMPLLIAMQAGVTDERVMQWVTSLPPEARLDGARLDGAPWPGAGPCFVRNPYREPDRNFDEEQPMGSRPTMVDGPFFTDGHLSLMADAMRKGKRYTLPELHRIFFRPAGAGFLMVGFGMFGPRPFPYVWTGDRQAQVVAPPAQGPPDWRAAGAVEPPFDHTFRMFVGRVPNLAELAHKFFERRIHIDGNPTGPPHEYVAARDNLFWSSHGQTANPIRVNVRLERGPTGQLAAAEVAEAGDGAFLLGFTGASDGPEGAFRFLDARTTRMLRLPDGRPLLGVRSAVANVALGRLDIGAILDRYTVTEACVIQGPPVEINGRLFALVHDRRIDGRPVQVQGPALQADGTWSVTPRFSLPGAAGAGGGATFYLGFTDTTFPFQPDRSEVMAVDVQSGEAIRDRSGAPLRILLARVEQEVALTLHETFSRIPGCAVPNPRYDPERDPYFDDLDANDRPGAGEPTFPFRPFAPPEVEARFDIPAGQAGYLNREVAYHVDPAIYSLPDGQPFSLHAPPPGFTFDRSPKDNGLRLRRFRPRPNGHLYARPHLLFARLLAAFPPSFFDGDHGITTETGFDILQCLALTAIRMETPEGVEDVRLDLDPGAGEVAKRMPFLEFRFTPGAEDPRVVMERMMAGFGSVPQ